MGFTIWSCWSYSEGDKRVGNPRTYQNPIKNTFTIETMDSQLIPRFSSNKSKRGSVILSSSFLCTSKSMIKRSKVSLSITHLADPSAEKNPDGSAEYNAALFNWVVELKSLFFAGHGKNSRLQLISSNQCCGSGSVDSVSFP